MTLTLSDSYGEGQTLLPKYPEPGKDSHHGDKFDFYAGDYGPHVIHTEEARILPVIGDNLDVLIGEGALDPALIQYYKDMYPHTFSDKNIIPYKNTDYYSYIQNEVKNKTLVTLHPYQNIDEAKYALDPNLIFDLNDKTNMYKLTSQIPKHQVLQLEKIRELNDFPFVLKAHSGASGDGVRIIRSKADLNVAMDWFVEEKNLMVEDFIEYKRNRNIQLYVSQEGDIQIIGFGDQVTNEEGEYDGNYIYLNDILEDGEVKLSKDIAYMAHKMGFYGICGLDILKGNNDEFYLIDPNFRINGSTSTQLLKNQIQAESSRNVLRFGSFKANHSDISSMLKSNLSLGKDSLYILSAYQDQVNNIISGYMVCTGDDKGDIEAKAPTLAKKGFTI